MFCGQKADISAASKPKVKVQPLYTQFVPFQLQHDPATKLPAELVHRIENLEFLEMAEMLPKTWASVIVIPLTHDSAMLHWPITQGGRNRYFGLD